ncbi:MAG: 16S rRNA (adenine(1518)-N(6)/adenine(1519)-N(6))-dimethyltransferase RsmA [Thermoplasmata archaeon]
MRKNEVISILSSLGVKPSKYRGQNFLIDERVVKRQITYADISNKDTVLEVGSGLGMLTVQLINNAGKVIAIEKDEKMASYLRNRLNSKLNLMVGDALKVNFPQFNKIVSNIPYNISSQLTFKFLEYSFEIAVLMYQKEFAERLVAKPECKEYSRLSVNAYYKARCEIVEQVPKTAFFPQPKVDSAIVKIIPRKEPPFKVLNEKTFLAIIDALFSHRRKKIKNGLVYAYKSLGCTENEMKDIALNAKFKSERVEDLSPEEIGEIADEIFIKLSEKA